MKNSTTRFNDRLHGSLILMFSLLVVFTLVGMTPEICSAAKKGACPLTIVRTLGADDDEILLHNPSWIRFADDGTIYLLNEGDCQVLQFNADWELLNSFGRCGEGPGEFSNCTGMILYHGKVWVFELARITVFDLAGEYVRTISSGNQYAAAEVIDDRILVRLGAGDRVGAVIDGNGEIIEYFGADCPVDFFESFKLCRNVQILPHPEGMCVFGNLVSSQISIVGADGYPQDETLLVETEDDSVMDESDDGESVSMSLSLCMGYGCRDSQGRYWFGTFAGEDQPVTMSLLDSNLKHITPDFELPEAVYPWMMFETPAGQLLLVATMESTIYVCDVAMING